MSQSTYQIICLVLVVVPFLVSCIKGNPMVGIIAAVAALFLMGLAAGQGASRPEVLLLGILIAGLGTAWSLHGN